MTQKYQWHLVRTINGEWVSEEYAVYMTKRSGNMRLKDASRLGIKFSLHPAHDGNCWCFRHELESLIKAQKENAKNTKYRHECISREDV